MPLPSYAPRSDSFGNWYFGGFQVDSSVEAGYGAATAMTATQSEFNTFLNSALGSGNWANTTGSLYFFRFNNAYEPLTGTVSGTANYRFYCNTISSQVFAINTAPTGTPVVIVSQAGNLTSLISPLFNSGNCAFAVANQYGMWIAFANKGTSGALGTTVASGYIGWAKDPVFPTNTSERVRNLIAGQTFFLATRAASTTTVPTNCVTNSVITCSVSTPGANITDLCVLDPNTSYLNIGSTYNGLIYPGTGLTPGALYRIPPAQDPDGNTQQNIWLCTDFVTGWNGSSQVASAGYKLIRVWSNGIA